ncbi:lipopolysaccharide biosynthesis protein [Mycolicibacterium sphagni]|uniref:lipopolysaccharide biosynthesis protein n=1 Tax=Mycolicibacterium sphagni TaxID=1786 RepID=UPI0023DFBB0F|nr:oligosaccharide flippase family protein [Mycolicibacterium sphagni]MCV7177494.1 hypothetical protein [Mycolicibacterium sphagni]
MNRVQSLKLGAIAQMLPIVAGYGSNFVATPFVVERLGLTNFGLWAVTGAIAQYGALLDLGVSRAIMRYVALYHMQGDRQKERAVVGGSVMIILSIGCVVSLFPLFIPAQLGNLIGEHNVALARILFFAAIILLVTGLLSQMFTAASIGRGRTVAANIGLSIQRIAAVAGGVVALAVTPSLETFAIGSAAGGAIGLVVLLLSILVDEREIRIGRPRREVFPDLIAFGLKGQAMSLCEMVLFQSGKIIAGIVIGPAAAGAYELGSRLALGARAFGTATSGVLSAHLTRAYASEGPDEIWRDYPRLVKRNAAVSNFALFFLVATSFSIVPLWLGSNSSDVIAVLISLAVVYTINVSAGVTTAAAFALNQLGTVMVGAVTIAVLAIGLAIPLAIVLGLPGILVGMVIAVTLGTLIAVVLIHRKSGIPLRALFAPIAGPFVVGTLSTLLAAPIGIILAPADRTSAVLPFLCSSAIFCALYMGLGWRFDYLPNLPRLRVRRAQSAKAVPGSDN